MRFDGGKFQNQSTVATFSYDRSVPSRTVSHVFVLSSRVDKMVICVTSPDLIAVCFDISGRNCISAVVPCIIGIGRRTHPPFLYSPSLPLCVTIRGKAGCSVRRVSDVVCMCASDFWIGFIIDSLQVLEFTFFLGPLRDVYNLIFLPGSELPRNSYSRWHGVASHRVASVRGRRDNFFKQLWTPSPKSPHARH